MTHEQKPESAEVRTREAQASVLMQVICDAGWRPDDAHECALRELSEAEARGAAEQRRKDAEGAEEWRPMKTAPKDGTPVLVKTVLTPDTFGDIRSHWNGRFVVVQHEGMTASGFDLRWRVACPVGFGGIPDEWFEGWRPVDRPANVAALEARVRELEGYEKDAMRFKWLVENVGLYYGIPGFAAERGRTPENYLKDLLSAIDANIERTAAAIREGDRV